MITQNNVVLNNINIAKEWRLDIEIKLTAATSTWTQFLGFQKVIPSPVISDHGERIPSGTL